MKRIATSKDMLFEQRLAQDSDSEGRPQIHPDHLPQPPGTRPEGKGQKPSPNMARSLKSDLDYGYDMYEVEDFMGMTDCPEGCHVEADGVCPHGYLSAARTLGFI